MPLSLMIIFFSFLLTIASSNLALGMLQVTRRHTTALRPRSMQRRSWHMPIKNMPEIIRDTYKPEFAKHPHQMHQFLAATLCRAFISEAFTPNVYRLLIPDASGRLSVDTGLVDDTQGGCVWLNPTTLHSFYSKKKDSFGSTLVLGEPIGSKTLKTDKKEDILMVNMNGLQIHMATSTETDLMKLRNVYGFTRNAGQEIVPKTFRIEPRVFEKEWLAACIVNSKEDHDNVEFIQRILFYVNECKRHGPKHLKRYD